MEDYQENEDINENDELESCDYDAPDPECPVCGEYLRFASIPDAVGNGLHEGWWCDECGEEVILIEED